MLVLSRRPNDKIVFPHLGITVEVLRCNGKTVRLGIDAPKDVLVLRHEVASDEIQQPNAKAADRSDQAEKESSSPLTPELTHDLRNRLNTAVIGLHLLHRKLEMGKVDDGDAAILKVLRELESMDETLRAIASRDQTLEAPTLRALLVDDNCNESALLADYLQTFGYHVDTAGNGIEALEYLAAHEKPDVVLLDMQMPGLDGAATIQQIRSDLALDGIRVFAVSGLTSEAAGVRIGPGGVDRWFTKPIRPSELVDAIRQDRACRKA